LTRICVWRNVRKEGEKGMETGSGIETGAQPLACEEESYAKEFMDDLQRADRCDWCGRDKRRNRVGLCRHCNEIRKKLRKLEKLALTSKPNFMLDWELKVLQQKKKDCISWGQMLQGILGAVDALDLEHWFCMIAQHIARDDRMHYGTATMLGWTFTAEQRQVLGYMFWEIFGAHASHNRQNRAAYIA
jgi:hypothetical protein